MPREKICGIYKITNIETGDAYIGSSKDVAARIIAHKRDLYHHLHRRKLQEDYDYYGTRAFTFEIILTCKIDELVVEECLAIAKYKPSYNGKKYIPQRGESGKIVKGASMFVRDYARIIENAQVDAEQAAQ